jgi:hypothetical protein
MAKMGSFFGGLMQGAGQGAMLGMQMKQQQEMLALRKRQAQLQEMESLVKISELPENMQEPFLAEWLKNNGVDPADKEGKGKFYMDLFKSSSAEQRKAFAQTLAGLGLEGKFDLKSLPKADIKTILALAPEMAKHQQAKKDQETIASIFSDAGIKEKEDTTPASNQGAVAAGGMPQEPPQIAQAGGVPMGAPTAQTQPRTMQGGSNAPQIVGGMSPMAQRNLELYQKLQLAATKVQNADTRKTLLDRADKLADNAWVTLTPAQSRQLGFKQGAIVQYNAIKNDAKVLQQGETTWRDMNEEERKASGITGPGIAQVSSTGEKKVHELKDTFKVVPVDQRPPGLENTPLKISSRGDIAPIAPGPSTQLVGEKKFEGKRGEDDAKYLADLRANRDTATAKLAAADQVEAAVQGFQTGAFGDQRKFLASVAELFGAQDSFAQLTKGDVVSAEVIDRVNSELVSKIPGSFKNTNATEIKIIQNNFPTLSRSVPGNKIVIDLMRKDAQLDDAIADMAEDHPGQPSEKDPKTGKNLYQKIAEFRRENPLIDDAMKKRIRGTVAFSKKLDPTGVRPLPPKDYPDANFIGYHPETGNPRFQTKEGRIFQMQLGE